MPATPPFSFKSAPDGEATHLATPTIVTEPTWSIAYPGGCASSAWIQLDRMPTFDREPDTIPDVAGGGNSYSGFIEYLDMGVSPFDDEGSGSGFLWQGRGVTVWDVWCDGVRTATSIPVPDGFVPPVGLIGTEITGGLFGGGTIDFTVPHSWQLKGTHFDRPSYSEFWINPATVGIQAFGPGTMTADPSVPYVVSGTPFGCCNRHNAFFPTAFWGTYDYWDPWVDAHHGVSNTSGPVNRWGTSYLGLTGPWGSDVPQQGLASGPGQVPCGPGSCEPMSLGDQAGGAGDVYASSFGSLVSTVTYSRVTYSVESASVTLPGCGATGNPVFDPTRTFRAVN